MKKPFILIILDGFGYSEQKKGNAVYGNTPVISSYMAKCPWTTIGASGMDVGLPDGQMGNSEVGHTNIGAGRVVYQELTRITKSVRDGDFFKNAALMSAVRNCKEKGAGLHLVGLVSDGGVHSHNTHLYALLELARREGLHRVYIHCLMDGRDVSPTSGKDYIDELEREIARIGVGKIATVMGRFYGMDRESRYDRVEKAYVAMVYREGVFASDAAGAVARSYADGVTDEFIVPAVIEGGEPVGSGDSVIFFNFRPDRARELTRSFVDPDFTGFERRHGFFPLKFVCMTQYDAKMPNVQVAFLPQSLENTFGQCVAQRGLTQLRIAETTKYAHVTFFFNGGVETVFPGEDRVLIETPNMASFDQKPEMSAYEVTDAVTERIRSGKYDVIILNFANCDMVGHTGVFDAAVKAVRTVDECVGRVLSETEKAGGVAILTADHGNADCMYDTDGSPFTAHTTNPVIFMVAGYACRLREGGRLADIAPTMLEIMGLPQPAEMDGRSLIAK